MALRRLALLEIIAHVHAMAVLRGITMSLHYWAQGEDGGIAEAVARASFLRSFDATDIAVIPDIAETKAGQFVVSASWEPNAIALQRLEECLVLERVRYDPFTSSPSLKRRMKRWPRPVARRLGSDASQG